MRFFRHIVYFLVFVGSMQAQQPAVVKGYITSAEEGDTIAGAVVSLSSNNATVSNADGSYSIFSPEGTYTLSCRMAGFQIFQRIIDLTAGEIQLLNIALSSSFNPLEEVVVSAGKYEQKIGEVSVSMEVIRPELIINKNTTSLDQIMNQVPGVQVADGQASIRGGSGFSYGAGSRVLMLIDEIPMISADAGDIKWNYLPIENLEQVEVIKGASSVLYGSGALNGIINLRTSFARNKPVTKAMLFYGSYDAPRHTYKWWKGSSQSQKGFNFSHAQKTGNLDLVIGAHKFNDDGYRMQETENRDRFNANLRYHFRKLPQLTAGVNTNMMSVRGGLFFLWQHYDSAYVPQGRDIQNYDNRRFNADPWVTWVGAGDSARAYKINFRNRYFLTQNNNDKGQGSDAELYYSELQFTKKFRQRLNITTGVVYMEQSILGDSIYGRHRGKNIAGYIQAHRKFLKDRLNATAGFRAEHFELDTASTKTTILGGKSGPALPFQPVLRLGLNYQAARQTYLRASFGQGYRFPGAAEKFVNTSVGVLKIFPNPSLQPERSYNAELSVKQGFRFFGFKGFADLATFYTRYSNMVEFVFDIYRPGGASGKIIDDLRWAGFKSQNVGEAAISGAEISVNGAGKIGRVKTTLLCGYTYINPVQVGFDPLRDTLGLPGVKTLKYRSRHLLKADMQCTYKKVSIGYSVRYQSRIENIDRRFVQSVLQEYDNPAAGLNFTDNPATYVLPGLKENYGAFSRNVLVQDVRVSCRISKQLRISFIINNLGNVEYQERPGDMRAPTMYLGQLLVQI